MKLKFLLSYFCLILTEGILGQQNVPRILGGTIGEIEDYPYIVSLHVNNSPWCGGSIISERHILTAAHCVRTKKIKPSYENLIVTSGTNQLTITKGDKHRVKSIDFYQELNKTDRYHDIAIITLRKNIVFNERQSKINLPSVDHTKHGVKSVVAGWGLTSFPKSRMSPVLLRTTMTILPSSTCTVFFVNQKPRYKIHDQVVCALERKGISVCLGDSGGPMVVGNEIVGITSWVIPCGLGFPDVFTHVYTYNDWIKKIINLS